MNNEKQLDICTMLNEVEKRNGRRTRKGNYFTLCASKSTATSLSAPLNKRFKYMLVINTFWSHNPLIYLHNNDDVAGQKIVGQWVSDKDTHDRLAKAYAVDQSQTARLYLGNNIANVDGWFVGFVDRVEIINTKDDENI